MNLLQHSITPSSSTGKSSDLLFFTKSALQLGQVYTDIERLRETLIFVELISVLQLGQPIFSPNMPNIVNTSYSLTLHLSAEK